MELYFNIIIEKDSNLQKYTSKAYLLDVKKYLKSDTEFVPDQEKHTKKEFENTIRKKYLEATCYEPFNDGELANHLTNVGRLVICAGNIANDHGEVTFLGKGGSDMTAAYMSVKLGAKCIEYWTTSFGLLTAPGSYGRVIKQLTYTEAIEICAAELQVLNPMALRTLQEHDAEVYVKSMPLYGKFIGTKISNSSNNQSMLKSICLRKGIIMISIETLDMWQQVGFLAEIFKVFKRNGISVDYITTSQSNITVTLDTFIRDENIQSDEHLQLIRELRQIGCVVDTKGPCAAISLVGKNITNQYDKLASVFKILNQQMHIISQSASAVNVTFLVDQNNALNLIEKIHSSCFLDVEENEIIGAPVAELLNPEEQINEVSGKHVWWYKKRELLLDLITKEGSPLYVYDKQTIAERCQDLLNMVNDKIIDRVFFALKSNSNKEIIKFLNTLGINFECVSIGEVKHVLSILPNLERKRILFTPNFAPKSIYEEALKLGINVTLDNSFPLHHWPEIFKGKEITLRIDHGVGSGFHEKANTGGNTSKFGIPLMELEEIKKLITKNDIKVIGLHCHVGSGVFDTNIWYNNAKTLSQLCEMFPTVEFLDLGGGFGVPYKKNEKRINIIEISEKLKDFKQKNPNIQLWLEPGRYLVGEAGVLLAKVTQTKQKGEFMYVGIESGMNHLLRPSLYGAYHEIVNLTKLGEENCWIADVVGPVCETGDIIGKHRKLPKCEEGDVMLICTCGAYAKSMSSGYNMHPEAKEIFLE